MDIHIDFRPSNSAAKIKLQTHEGMVTEAGSMIAMSGNIELETSTHQKGKGGFLSGVKRMFAGESFSLIITRQKVGQAKSGWPRHSLAT